MIDFGPVAPVRALLAELAEVKDPSTADWTAMVSRVIKRLETLEQKTLAELDSQASNNTEIIQHPADVHNHIMFPHHKGEKDMFTTYLDPATHYVKGIEQFTTFLGIVNWGRGIANGTSILGTQNATDC